MTVSTEFDRYPRTGRFLAGRLRSEMSEAEKTELEGLVVDTMTLRDGARAIARGDACNWSAILIDGFVLRTLENGGRRYAVRSPTTVTVTKRSRDPSGDNSRRHSL